MKPPIANARMLATAERMARSSSRYTHAVRLVTQAEALADTMTTPGERVHTSGVSNPTEAQALARAAADEWRQSLRDHLDDWVNTSDLFADRIEEAARWASSRLGLPLTPLPDVVLCSGEGYSGRDLPWRPHGQDPLNGWHDPTCREVAIVRDGVQLRVCRRCLRRLEPWLARQGLPPVIVREPARGET